MRQAATRHLLLALRFADNPTGTAHPGRIGTGNGTSFDLAGGRFVVKPGSVGQPRDGDPRASCLELDVGATASEGVVVAVHRASFDIETVQARICKAGLRRYLRDRLADGRDEWTNWMVATGDEWLHRDEADPPPARFPVTHGMRSRARQNRRVHQARQGGYFCRSRMRFMYRCASKGCGLRRTNWATTATGWIFSNSMMNSPDRSA